jgi:hypothetical protein
VGARSGNGSCGRDAFARAGPWEGPAPPR